MWGVSGSLLTPVDSVGVVNIGRCPTCSSEVESLVQESVAMVTNCDGVPSNNKYKIEY